MCDERLLYTECWIWVQILSSIIKVGKFKYGNHVLLYVVLKKITTCIWVRWKHNILTAGGREVTFDGQQLQCDGKYCKPCHDHRYNTAKELLQTEENYVTTLSTILKVHRSILHTIILNMHYQIQHMILLCWKLYYKISHGLIVRECNTHDISAMSIKIIYETAHDTPLN